MASQLPVTERKQWTIPQSYDLGIPYYYYNILKGSEYIDRYLTAQIAFIDRKFAGFYEKLKTTPMKDIPYDEMPQTGYNGVMHMLKGTGIDEGLLSQLRWYINHLAFKPGNPVNLLRIKEFFAFCGVPGLYNLHEKTHFCVPHITNNIPFSLDPAVWKKADDVEAERTAIAFLMDVNNEINSDGEEYMMLSAKVWGPFMQSLMELTKQGHDDAFIQANTDSLSEEYIENNPHLKVDLDRINEIEQHRQSRLESFLNTYAPMDPDFTLPKVGSEFDKDWDDRGRDLMLHSKPYRDIYEAHVKAKGISRDDEAYEPFDWEDVEMRAYSIFDYAIRDYTMNDVNRGGLAEFRQYDVPRDFVAAVKAELADGLLSIVKPPHRIEAVADKPGSFHYILNGAEAGTFTLDEVYALEKELDKDVKPGEPSTIPVRKSRKANLMMAQAPAPKIVPGTYTHEEFIKIRLDGLTDGNNDGPGMYKIDLDSLVAALDSGQALEDEIAYRKAAAKAGGYTLDENYERVDDAESVIEGESVVITPVADKANKSDSPAIIITPSGLPSVNWSPQRGQQDNAKLSVPETKAPRKRADKAPDIDVDEDGPFMPDAREIAEQKRTGTSDDNNDVALSFGKPNPFQSSRQAKVDTPEAVNNKLKALKDYAASDLAGKSLPSEAEPRGRPFSPPQFGQGGGNPFDNLNIDLGVSALVNGIRQASSAASKGVAKAVGVQHTPSKVVAALDSQVMKLDSLKNSLSSMTGPDGYPLTPDALVDGWMEMAPAISRVGKIASKLKKCSADEFDIDTRRSLKEASQVLDESSALISRNKNMPGIIGDLAKQAEKVMETVRKVFSLIMKMIGRALGMGSKSPA